MSEVATEKEYICVSVQNPTIHNTYDEGRYTTFDVELKTNSLSFTKKHSVVQRRYSDFQWLRKTLSRTTGGTPPSLPFGRLFGTFDEEYLTERQKILTAFMQKVVRDTVFVSSAALHLFLQTELSRKDMDNMIKEAKRRGSMNSIVRAISTYGSRLHRSSSRLSVGSFNRSIGGTSFSEGVSPTHSVPQMDMSFPSLPALSSIAMRSETSPDFQRDWNLTCYDLPNGVSAKKPFSYDEKNDGDWVVIEDSLPSPSSDMPSLNASSSPISSQDYTRVSWKIGGDFRSSSENLRPTCSQQSRDIPVPSPQRSKDCIFGPLVSQSFGASRQPPHSKSPSSLTCRVVPADMRRVASDSNVSQLCLESNPPSLDSSSSLRGKHPISDQVTHNAEPNKSMPLDDKSVRLSSEISLNSSNLNKGFEKQDFLQDPVVEQLDVVNDQKAKQQIKISLPSDNTDCQVTSDVETVKENCFAKDVLTTKDENTCDNPNVKDSAENVYPTASKPTASVLS